MCARRTDPDLTQENRFGISVAIVWWVNTGQSSKLTNHLALFHAFFTTAVLRSGIEEH
jgi:hypothetical protein